MISGTVYEGRALTRPRPFWERSDLPLPPKEGPNGGDDIDAGGETLLQQRPGDPLSFLGRGGGDKENDMFCRRLKVRHWVLHLFVGVRHWGHLVQDRATGAVARAAAVKGEVSFPLPASEAFLL